MKFNYLIILIICPIYVCLYFIIILIVNFSILVITLYFGGAKFLKTILMSWFMKLIFMSPLGKVLTSSNFEWNRVLLEFIQSFLVYSSFATKKKIVTFTSGLFLSFLSMCSTFANNCSYLFYHYTILGPSLGKEATRSPGILLWMLHLQSLKQKQKQMNKSKTTFIWKCIVKL